MTVTEEVAGAAPVTAVAKQKKSILQFELTRKKVKRKELMHFSRQLAVFLKAGIPILAALDAISEEMNDDFLRGIVQDVIVQLEQGLKFSDAMDRHHEAFPAYYLGILRSAEYTGKLDVVLVQLAAYVERDVEARRKVTSALAYPGVILATSVVVVVVLVSFVLPKFEVFFASLDAKLPLPTRMLLNTAHFLTHRWYLFAGLAVVLTVLAILSARTASGRSARDRLLLRLPIVGDLVRHVVLERFCRILSAMMQAGVPLTSALEVTNTAVSNTVYQKGLAEAREAMLRGEGLAGPLIETGLFPPSARQMFRVGESTGTLDDQLETAAIYFDRELDYKIKGFTTLFEPAVLLFVGLIVGFVAIALVSAMYGIFGQTRGL